jgi:outer membrane protein assembly factor BamB
MVLSLILTSRFIHVSMRTSMMGLMFPTYSIPLLSLAFVAWAAASRRLSDIPRRASMVGTIVVASVFWVFLRTDGMDGSTRQDFAWRWAKTKEEQLLARTEGQLKASRVDSAAVSKPAEWPGFRGVNRDGIVTGVQISTDWSKSRPAEIWRRPVGPGCSSFAVLGKLLFTQEQRGESEMVTCYNLDTGEPIWIHSDPARFWDSHAGAGPRATPTVINGRVYTMGATGILNALDARSGTAIWTRNAANDTGVKVLTWGFTGSPLVFNNLVIVALSGKLEAYDLATGKPRWSGHDGGNSYSSPHLVTIGGVPQVVLMSQAGATSTDPANGKQLWEYAWPVIDRILQPAVIADGDLLISRETEGISRISLSNVQGKWTAKETWTSADMKLNFNDFIVHKGYAYGFDGPRIACIDLSSGKIQWKGKPYRGFTLLLADQDLLVVLSEKGELALVEANPKRFMELAGMPALKGKTWNHPVLAGDILVVRNSSEMVAFRLARVRD